MTVWALFMESGTRVCTVAYMSDGDGASAMEDIFDVSIETIVITEQTGSTVVF